MKVELYSLRQRVSQLYFGLLLLDSQDSLLALHRRDLEGALQKNKAAVDNGVAIPNNVLLLEAELLTLAQRSTAQRLERRATLEMLSLLTGQSLNENTVLERPVPIAMNTDIIRPELRMFEWQNRQVEAKIRQLSTRYIPTVGLFGQGGYGRPALNF
ncbi:MAG: hypothetical protein R2795_23465 [Saprospiraceae bacterium]